MLYVRAFGVRVLAAAVLVLAAASTASAQTGTVSGTITNAATAAPLGGVGVQLLNASGLTVATSPFTTGTGVYATPAVPAGTYFVRTTSGIGFVNKVHNDAGDVDCYINCTPQNVGSLVTVPAGGTATVNFAMSPGGGITGTITNSATGAPIQNVQVQLGGPGNSFAGQFANTNASGVFTFSGAAAGSYQIKTFNSQGFLDEIHSTPNDLPCFGCAFSIGGLVTVPANTGTTPTINVTGIDFALDPGGFISGTLILTPDPPLGATVNLYNSAGFSTGFFFTADAAGNYKTSGLPPDTYYLRAVGTTTHVGRIFPNNPCVGCSSMSPQALAALILTGTPLVIVDATTELTGKNLTLPTGGTITGTVTNGGNPVVGANVSAFTLTGTQVSNFGGASVTNGAGAYTLGPLETSAVQVAVTSTGGQNVIETLFPNKTCVPCFSPIGGDPVNVTLGAATPNIDFSLPTGGQITGTVKRKSDNTAITGVSVRAVDQSNGFTTIRTATTNGAGAFTLSGLPTSTYFIGTQASSQGFVDRAFNDILCIGCNLTGGTAIPVTAGSTVLNADFLLDLGGTISGKVSDAATTAGLASYSLTAAPLSGAFSSAFTTTDANGTFAFRGLPDDTYFIKTTTTGRGYINEFFDDVACANCPATSGTPIVIANANTQANRNIALATGGAISGLVTGVGGARLQGISVSVNFATGGFAASATTDDQGRYTVNGLSSGQYTVLTSNANTFGYINQIFSGIGCSGTCSTTGATKVDVTAPGTTNNVNFPLALGGRVTGRVTDASLAGPNNGVPDVTITIFNNGSSAGSTKSNATGDFVINGVAAGTLYTAKATGAGIFIEQLFNGKQCLNCSATLGTAFSVTAGGALVLDPQGDGVSAPATTGGIDFPLVKGTTIAGRVTDAVTGAPIQSVNVAISDGFTTVSNAFTNANGDYKSAALPAGTYFARTTSNPGSYINQLFSNIPCLSCQPSTGTTIVVTSTPGAITGKDFALAKGGSIEGTVLKASDSSPVQSASVSVYTSGGTFVASGAVAGNGTYAVRGLPTDNYFAVTSNSSGFINQVFQGQPCTTCIPSTGTPISVTAGVATTNRNFLLTRGGGVTGTVTTQGTNTPIAGIPVQVYSSTGQLLTTATTNALGVYTTAAGLPTGDYFLRTSNSLGFIDVLYQATPCIACSPATGTPVHVTAAAPPTAGIDFSLAQGGQVSGTVRTAVGAAPIESVSVTLFTADGRSVRSATTNASGLFNITGLAGGTYFARTSNSQGFIDQIYSGKAPTAPLGSGTPISVAAGATTQNINFDMVAGGRVSGRVTDANGGAPLASVNVSIFNAAGAFVANGFSNANGDYRTFGGLATGTYFARTNNSLGYIDEVYNDLTCLTCLLNGQPIPVTAGSDTPNVNFALLMGGRISGTVTDNASPTPHPIANATVQAFSATGESFASATTGSNGQFITNSGLPTGKYFLRATSRQGFIPQLFNGKDCPACAPLTGDAIDVTAGATTAGKNFALKPGGLISGTVTATGGGPLAGINVTIFNNINIAVSGAVTDSEGKYLTTSGLPTGNYFARTSNGQGYIDEVYNNVAVGGGPNSGTAIAVIEGQITENIDISLAAGGRIAGRVTDAATGLPLASIQINVADSTGKAIAFAQTDQAGAYTTGAGVTGGASYFVFTTNNQGYIDKLFSGTTCLVCNPTLGTPVPVTTNTTTQNIDFALSVGGRISGTITGTDVGDGPLFGIQVAVYNAAGAFAGLTSTDGLGQYVTRTGLPSGTYFARTFNLRGYIDELFDNNACAPCEPLNGAPVPVIAGTTKPGISFALSRGGVVSGYVVDQATNAPIAGVTVSFFLQPANTFAGRSRPTDANGYFAISLPIGDYLAQPDAFNGYVKPPGSPSTAAATSFIRVDRGSETGGVVFPLTVCTPPSLAPSTLATVTKGFAASQTISTTGGTGPFTFSVSDGTLTPGLTLSATGGITGTPTTTGTANFTVAATGASGCAGTQTFNQLTCGVSFGATGASFTSTGGNGSLSIVATSADCAWSIGGGASFVALSPSGVGNKSVSLQLAPNTSPVPRSTTLTLGTQTFTITQGGTVTSAPFGLIDTPLDGVQNVTGSIGVTGWALDDLAITSIEVWRDPVAPEAAGQQIFIGNAVQVEGARPDVQQQFSTVPFNSRAGWGYLMLTNFLPNQGNGPVKLYVYTRDLDGKTTLLGTRTINTSNGTATIPFGAIDTPGQGATTSGNAFINFGWALTPQPKSIPTDGSSIVVFVDGAPIGAVDSYNNARSDIQALFPNYANTDGAVGFKSLDTTQLADGVHTIAWVATDDQGAAAGIGSRFFTVANGSNLIAGSRAAASVARAFRNPNVIARAPDPNAPPPASAGGLWKAGDDATEIVQRPLDLLEFALGDAACGPFTGHLVVDGKLEPLPFGTSIAEGTFRWQPGVGYFGTYRMVFTSSCGVVRLRAVLKP